ncbi:MAG: tRNA pseudouridine(55) synthase TruB [Gammaproteobacteria bacterium]|nr:tRNA pseudouridine(55) synthase TruB [Gammaproteobacteria bacterium]
MGRRRKGRPVDGVLLLDKPQGITSNRALQIVKRLYGAAKAGHTGSLDPLATGLLPICLGNATKMSAFLLDADKHYRVTARLGSRTDTADADGEIIEEREVPEFDEERLNAVLREFTGDIDQIPPMYSALKKDGKRLYEIAREGGEVEREPRRVRIFSLQLDAIEGNDISLSVRCSKGTYIRSLVEDVAAALGTVGHVVVLRRTGVGPFEKRPMYSIEELEAIQSEGGHVALDEKLLPVDSPVVDWPLVRLDSDSTWYVQHGQAVLVPKAPVEGHVRLYAEDDGFLGIGEVADDGRIAPKRLVSHA